MIDPNKYLQIVELIKSRDDLETVEAFMYNRGKIVIDKKDFYQNYTVEERRVINEVNAKPKRNRCILSFGGSDSEDPVEEEDDDCGEEYKCYR